jgi:hypothetical protein
MPCGAWLLSSLFNTTTADILLLMLQRRSSATWSVNMVQGVLATGLRQLSIAETPMASQFARHISAQQGAIQMPANVAKHQLSISDCRITYNLNKIKKYDTRLQEINKDGGLSQIASHLGGGGPCFNSLAKDMLDDFLKTLRRMETFQELKKSNFKPLEQSIAA